MMLLVWPLLFFLGARAKALRLRSFVIIVLAVAAGTVFYDYITVNDAAAIGQDQSFRWHPAVFLLDVAVTSALWSLTYLVGFALGRWWRINKKTDG